MGGYKNKCGKYYQNPSAEDIKYAMSNRSAENILGSSPNCTEQEVLEYKKKSLSRQIKLKEDKKENADLLSAKLKQLQDEESRKVYTQYLIYGVIAVVGYLAYKKFKK